MLQKSGISISFTNPIKTAKWKTTPLTLKYRYFIRNRFQVISPVLNTFRFLNFYTGKSWCQSSHCKQARSDTFLFSRLLEKCLCQSTKTGLWPSMPYLLRGLFITLRCITLSKINILWPNTFVNFHHNTEILMLTLPS